MNRLNCKHWALRAVWAVLAVGLLWALTWLALPPLLRYQGQKIASEVLGRTVRIEQVEWTPWSLELTLRGLEISAAQTGDAVAARSAAQLRVERIYANVEIQSLWQRALVVQALEVDQPALRLAQLAPGQLDIDDIVQRLGAAQDKPGSPQEPGRFAFYNIVVRGGSLDLEDRSMQRTHEVRALELGVPFISSLPRSRHIVVEPYVSFELNGSRFRTEAWSAPFDPQQEMRARLRLQDLDVAGFAPYVAKVAPVQLQAGKLSADLMLRFVQQPQASVHIQGHTQVQGLRLADVQGAPLLAWESLQVEIADLQPLVRQGQLARLQLDGLQVHVQRNSSGKLNWSRLAAAEAAPAPVPERLQAGEGATPAPPWQVGLQTLAVRGAQVHWQDQALPGMPSEGVQWGLRDVQLDAHTLAWPQRTPAQFAAQMQWVGAPGGSPAAAALLALQGEFQEDKAQVAASVRGVALQWAAPYLRPYLVPQLGGQMDADVGMALNGPAWAVHLARLTLDGVALSCPEGADCQMATLPELALRDKNSLAEIKRLSIEGARIQSATQAIRVQRMALTQPRVRVARNAQGQWMAQQWLAAASPQPAPASLASAQAPQPWALHWEALEIDAGALALQDAMPQTPVALQVSGLRVRLTDFAPLATSPVPPAALELSARVGAGRTEAGRLAYEGHIGLLPVQVRGQLTATALPLHALEPYVRDALNVQVRRAEGSFKGTVNVALQDDGAHVHVQGDAALEELRVRSHMLTSARVPEGEEEAPPALRTQRSNELLRCKSLDVRGLQLQMVPGQASDVQVREVAVQDFFARLIVQENGRLNLQDVLKSAEPAEPPVESAAAPSAEPAPPSPAAMPAAVVRIGPIAVAGGHVQFSDYFIKPNYSADLSELTGRLGAFSSVPAAAGAPLELATLELRGRAQGSAQLEIVGALNPLAQPLALDIQGKVRDLELPPLSPYTIKYAGHGIERGKLNMDVGYKVQADGQLTAENKIVLKQLTFGEPVDGAPASLPVRLATALLSDSNGVIDLDLPLSGSLNDPEFRIAPVIFKILGNLIVKAVTAPFTLLAKAFGAGAADWSTVAFAPGSARLDATARAALDKVAQALQERAQLTLTVVGKAHTARERDGWQQEQLLAMLQSQKRRTAQRVDQGAAGAVEVPAVTPEEIPLLLKEVYRRADIPKPRNLVGLVKDLPTEQMRNLLLTHITVPPDAMPALALARAVAVRDYLAEHQVPMERLFLGAVQIEPEGEEWTPHAALSLAMQ